MELTGGGMGTIGLSWADGNGIRLGGTRGEAVTPQFGELLVLGALYPGASGLRVTHWVRCGSLGTSTGGASKH